MVRRLGVVTAVLSALAWTPAAHAGTVANGNFTAGPGEANAITVTLTGFATRFSDAGALLQVGAGCTRVDASTATCATVRIAVDAGDGDDTVSVVNTGPTAPAPFEPSPSVTVTAGTGRDVVSGSNLPDVFVDGGAGEADTYDGAASDNDELRYTGRTTGVTVALGGGGEDRISSVSRVLGGSGPDTLAGAGGDEVLIGADGADRLAGGGGDDLLADRGRRGERDAFDGGPGDDTVSYSSRTAAVRASIGTSGEDALTTAEGIVGSPRDDVLTGSDGADSLDGGPGRDRLRGLGGSDVLSGDAGRDRLDGGRGNDLLDLGIVDEEVLSIGGPTFDALADGARDTAACGPGRDAVRLRDETDVARECEATVLDDTFVVDHRLTRPSPGTLRLHVRDPPFRIIQGDPPFRIVVTPRGRSRPRLTRPTSVEFAGTVRLRLTAAGRRYLRDHTGVAVRAAQTDDVIHARVAR